MRILILAATAVFFIGGAVQAAPVKRAVHKAPVMRSPVRDPQAEFTTRSAAGYVYRRASQVTVVGDASGVAPAEVVVPNRRAQSRRAARQPFSSIGASTSGFGAINPGLGVNVGEIPSSNRSGR